MTAESAGFQALTVASVAERSFDGRWA